MNRNQLAAWLGEATCALADWRGGEGAWRRRDLGRLAVAAESAGLACIGGQAQIRLNDATFELYWCDYDPTPRRFGEPWAAYASRSWKEQLFLAEGLPADEDLIADAKARFEALADLPDTDLVAGLWFVVYPEAEPK